MVIDLLQFTFQLLIAGFLLRYAELKLANTEIGSALHFIY